MNSTYESLLQQFEILKEQAIAEINEHRGMSRQTARRLNKLRSFVIASLPMPSAELASDLVLELKISIEKYVEYSVSETDGRRLLRDLEILLKHSARATRYVEETQDLVRFPRSSTDHKTVEISRNVIFISYSHLDQPWLEKLQTMLVPLKRTRRISVWADTSIKTGTMWRSEIQRALKSAQIAVLLVSPNFLASDFVAEHELPPLLNAAERQGLRIIWIAVSTCLVNETPLANYQAANNPLHPLDSLSNAELNRELVMICEKIKAAAEIVE